ncbi:TPA: HNH endonuclease [Escherichia coli]|nr:HNH endonuclease [Escherichia coli]
MIGNDVFMRAKKDEPWSDKGGINTDLFLTAVSSGYWLEISALEAGDRPYADCSKCAENWPELFDYHPDGYLISKVARASVKPGDIIRGWANGHNKNKSHRAGVNGRAYSLHRIVYEMFNGPIPDGYYIENADNSCAKIENLKLISKSECSIKKGMTTGIGIKGITWRKSKNKWQTQIMVNQISHHLGYYDNINDAINARINGEIRYFGKQMNPFPDYISPEDAESIKQSYYEGDEMKQIEINTEPPEPVPEPPRGFKYHGYDIRVNEADELSLIDIAAAMGVVNEDDLRHRIDSLNKLPGYIYCTEQYNMQIDKGYAPFEIAGMVAARIGAEKDRIDLSLAFHKFKNDRMSAAIAQQADNKQAEDLKDQVKALEQEISGKNAVIKQLIADKAKADAASAEQTERDANAVASAQQKVEELEDEKGLLSWQLKEAREARDSYHSRIGYWVKQYKQANKAFGEEESKRQKLERQIDNLIKDNCHLRQQLNTAYNDDAKAKAAADKQTINDLRADLQEARETIKEQQQEADSKALVIRGYQLKLAELEDDKAELQRNVKHLQDENNQLAERYNKLVDRNLQRRAAQKRYMHDLLNDHVMDALEWMQASKVAEARHQRRQERHQQRYRKLIMALQQRVKDLLYRLDKKPEMAGFWQRIKDSFHVQH